MCWALGITEVDALGIMLVERFISRVTSRLTSTGTPEHERREEVIQYVYQVMGGNVRAAA